MIKNDWHFARPELAESYLNLFDVGLISARGLFARRRMGKTEFLKKDFIPLAQKKGYLVVYSNLWELEVDPATALVSELYKAIAPKGFEKVWSKLKIPINKVKATGKLPGGAEASIEADFKPDKKISGTLLMEAMSLFDQTKYHMIIVIDEAQVLAYLENAHFAHALRSVLDVRKEKIKVVFAGSSENTLRKMFGVPSEPFYNWAPLEPFPLLGSAFVEAMVQRVNAISQYPLSQEEAMEAFSQLKNTPEFFRRYIEHYLLHPLEGSTRALEDTKNKVFNDENFNQQWDALLPADQIILSMIAKGTVDLHGKQALQQLGAALGLAEGVTRNTAQNALRRLAQKNMITKLQYGRYQVEDEAFADWVKYRE